jgi:hypothetical protein
MFPFPDKTKPFILVGLGAQFWYAGPLWSLLEKKGFLPMRSSIATLKENGFRHSVITEHLSHFLADKGFGPVAEQLFVSPDGKWFLSQLLGQFLLLLPPYEAASTKLRQSIAAGLCGEPRFSYFGTPQENAEILQSLTSRGDDQDEDDSFQDSPGQALEVGRGVARHFSLRGFHLGRRGLGAKMARTPIVFIGAGPATILLARTLCNAGFRHLTVIDPGGEYGGIWTQKNVRGASRNNPAPMMYEAVRTDAAPGDGEHVTQFLTALASPPAVLAWRPLPKIMRGKVTGVIPGDLGHVVFYKIGSKEYTIEAPIVVAATGQGKPLPPSRPGVMTTNTPQAAGIRWQQILTHEQATSLQGKTVVLIGLGNSTAEMLVQLLRFRRAGYDIRIKVLTHYPRAAINAPRFRQSVDGKDYILYRRPDDGGLTALAGDLEEVRDAFIDVRDENDPESMEVITDVEHWDLVKAAEEHPHMAVRQRSGRQRVFPADQVYTLIGYGHPEEVLRALGLFVLDAYAGTVAVDYDGEVQRALIAPGRDRVYPGYFAAGALIKSPLNDNAQVIPGMLFRLPNQLCSICLRAAEYALLQKQARAIQRTPR